MKSKDIKIGRIYYFFNPAKNLYDSEYDRVIVYSLNQPYRDEFNVQYINRSHSNMDFVAMDYQLYENVSDLIENLDDFHKNQVNRLSEGHDYIRREIKRHFSDEIKNENRIKIFNELKK